MHVTKDQVDVTLELPGAVLRQQLGFGAMPSSGQISAEYFTLAKGVETTALFEGLEGDLCQCPHWGFVLRGQLTTTDAHGGSETVRADDLFYWPPGHNVHVEEDAEIIMFSPEQAHTQVIDHMRAKVSG